MSITVQRDISRDHRVELVVEQSAPMVITVRAGSFKVRGEWSLAEDFEVAIEADADYSTSIVGYLARHRESGAVVLALDEIVNDDNAILSRWVDYEPLHPLFSGSVPRGAVSLNDVPITVQHLIAPPERVKRVVENIASPPVNPPEKAPEPVRSIE